MSNAEDEHVVSGATEPGTPPDAEVAPPEAAPAVDSAHDAAAQDAATQVEAEAVDSAQDAAAQDAAAQDAADPVAADQADAPGAVAGQTAVAEAASIATPGASEPEPEPQAEPTIPHQRFDLATEREAGFAAARAALAQGRCIVLPTDTVYGIAANALNPDAVQALLNAKDRGRDMPPPVLIAEPAMLPALVAKVPRTVDKIVAKYWPGALTVILKAQESLKMDLGQTNGTIAVRVPDNADARDLLRSTGPLAVSSANISGQPAATDVDAAIAQLGDRVAVYLDGGATPGPMPSTILDYASSIRGRVVRAGLISHADLVALAPLLLDIPAPEPEPEPEPEAAPEPKPMPVPEPAPEQDQPKSPIDDFGSENDAFDPPKSPIDDFGTAMDATAPVPSTADASPADTVPTAETTAPTADTASETTASASETTASTAETNPSPAPETPTTDA